MLQIGKVYLHDDFTGILKRENGEFIFEYDKEYLNGENSKAISLSLPLRVHPYTSKTLFPFFEGLLAEGWLRKVQEQNQKIDKNNSFELLINNGIDLVGAVRVEKHEM